MTKREQADKHWTCPHGFVTGFFPVPGHPLLIEHRSCGICCEEISERISRPVVDGEQLPVKKAEVVECSKCGAPVPFGSCCDECDEPTDH